MKVGNIVSESSINVSDDFNVVSSMDNIIHGLPTLIIGWDIVKRLYPNTDIMNRQLDELTSWTFKKKERRDIHEEELLRFIQEAYNYLITQTEYVFIDPINLPLRTIKKIIRKIKDTERVISFHHKDMVYIVCGKIIFGVDLKLLKFMGFNNNKIISKINAISSVFLNNDAIIIEYSGYVERLNNEAKYIPFLYSIKNE